MPAPKYSTPEHRAQRKQLAGLIAAGDGWCVEAVCLMPSRWIEPGTPWDVAHDSTGTQYRGAAHSRCNRSEGATRGNRQCGTAVAWNRGGGHCEAGVSGRPDGPRSRNRYPPELGKNSQGHGDL